jgi:SAM-dependent methyltransferase
MDYGRWQSSQSDPGVASLNTDKWTWEQSVAWLRQQPDQQALVRACYYDDPLLAAAQRFLKSDEWQALRTYLPRHPGRVIDIGAGRGISTYALAREGWQVVALEPDTSFLVGSGAIRDLACETGLPITVEEAFGEAMPFEDNSFDLVYGREVLHHANDLLLLCLEVARLLKPGGWFIVTRETVISRPQDLDIFLEKHPLHKFFGGENAFLLDSYLSAISASGLVIKKILGPLDNPINFQPFDYEYHEPNIRKQVCRKVRHWLVRSFYGVRSALAHRLPQKYALRFFSALEAPGRLYSFIAQKPSG